jgi:hypothetical protein
MSPESRVRLTTPAALAGIAGVLCAAMLSAAPASASAAPTVQAMVVGSSGQILAGPRNVTASATSVTVGHKRCSVAAGTPLAVLAQLHGAGGPGFLVRDYGRCGSSQRNSGSLFVYDLAGETNGGRSGWEYKVSGLSGSAGAGDASGPQGDGRLIGSGAQVLWFYCHAVAGGCQRTLSLSSATSVTHGGHLSVRVAGYDNEGRAAPVAGAIVTLDGDFASTNANGSATLIVPSAGGRYSLTATRHGLVPAFPETISVR